MTARWPSAAFCCAAPHFAAIDDRRRPPTFKPLTVTVASIPDAPASGMIRR
jgi:hypothetical protein